MWMIAAARPFAAGGSTSSAISLRGDRQGAASSSACWIEPVDGASDNYRSGQGVAILMLLGNIEQRMK